MSTPVEQIKSRLNIVDVVGEYVRLQKAGSAHKGLCPFHSEKTPSFTVSPVRQSFHCFGCNKGGDIFSFIEEIEGLDFPGALKVLAQKAGVELKKEDRKASSERERWYSIMETASRFYISRLKPGGEPYEYLLSRGLTKETIAHFRIGFAPSEPEGWHALSLALNERGIKDPEIERVGLSKKNEKTSPDGARHYDRFRSRIMFPIMDSGGRVIAFSGRIFGTDDPTVGKYINSPETGLYDKSSVLFGFDKAKSAIRKQNFAVIVEGQMDLIMAHQGGSENTVAVSGTALTEKHLGLLKRLTPNVIFAFDGDSAGVNATARAFTLALSQGMNVRVAGLPNGLDPADVIRKSPEEWHTIIKESKHIVDFFLDVLLREETDMLTKRKRIEEVVIPFVAEIRSSVEQAHFILEIARRIGVPDSALWESLRKVRVARQYVGVPETKKQAIHVPLLDRLRSEVLGILYWQESEKGNEQYAPRIRREFERITGSPPDPLVSEAERNTLIVQVEQTYDPEKITQQFLDDLLTRYEIATIEERQAESHQRLMMAEKEKNEGDIRTALEEFQESAKVLQALKAKIHS